MRRFFISAIAVLLVFGACSKDDPFAHDADAPSDNVPNIVSKYVLNGIDPIGEPYVGFLDVVQRDDGDFDLHWIITGSLQDGVGHLEGNQLTVVWSDQENGIEDRNGTATYTVTVTGQLYGEKRVEGFDGTWYEAAGQPIAP